MLISESCHENRSLDTTVTKNRIFRNVTEQDYSSNP